MVGIVFQRIAMNKRANEMWDIVTKRVSFKNKTVIDVGCGSGDFVIRAVKAGATKVIGVERDYLVGLDAVACALEELDETQYDKVDFVSVDIEEVVQWHSDKFEPCDIIICFSVLPYLLNVWGTLEWMRNTAKTTLIECQYKDDGPGLPWLGNDADMKKLLKDIGWKRVSPLGKTDVRIRPAYRTIWKCEG
jgi:SAM-dependent methyltransferase